MDHVVPHGFRPKFQPTYIVGQTSIPLIGIILASVHILLIRYGCRHLFPWFFLWWMNLVLVTDFASELIRTTCYLNYELCRLIWFTCRLKFWWFSWCSRSTFVLHYFNSFLVVRLPRTTLLGTHSLLMQGEPGFSWLLFFYTRPRFKICLRVAACLFGRLSGFLYYVVFILFENQRHLRLVSPISLYVLEVCTCDIKSLDWFQGFGLFTLL